jgi:hypothetical protein
MPRRVIASPHSVTCESSPVHCSESSDGDDYDENPGPPEAEGNDDSTVAAAAVQFRDLIRSSPTSASEAAIPGPMTAVTAAPDVPDWVFELKLRTQGLSCLEAGDADPAAKLVAAANKASPRNKSELARPRSPPAPAFAVMFAPYRPSDDPAPGMKTRRTVVTETPSDAAIVSSFGKLQRRNSHEATAPAFAGLNFGWAQNHAVPSPGHMPAGPCPSPAASEDATSDFFAPVHADVAPAKLTVTTTPARHAAVTITSPAHHRGPKLDEPRRKPDVNSKVQLNLLTKLGGPDENPGSFTRPGATTISSPPRKSRKSTPKSSGSSSSASNEPDGTLRPAARRRFVFESTDGSSAGPGGSKFAPVFGYTGASSSTSQAPFPLMHDPTLFT